jgi:hypothetical protein
VLEELGDPGDVLDVGLAAGHLRDVLGVDQQDVEAALQEVPDRPPVDTGRLHGDVGDAFGGQPIGQGEQVRGVRAEGTRLLLGLLG